MNLKKYFYLFLFFIMVLSIYRYGQYKKYMAEHREVRLTQLDSIQAKPYFLFKKVVVKNQIEASEIEMKPNYQTSALNSIPLIYFVPDTLYLKRSETSYLEYEILADSSVEFTNIKIIKDDDSDYSGTEEPFYNRKESSFWVGRGRAIWLFIPSLYGENLKAKIYFEYEGFDFTHEFSIRNVEDVEYNKILSRKLDEKSLAIKHRLEMKYKSIIANYYSYKKTGTSKSKSYQYGFDLDKFKKDSKRFSQHNYSNQFICKDSGFYIIVTVGNNQKIEVEPINNK